MADKPTEPRATENPRTARVRDAVLAAVIELVLTEGAGAVTALRVSEQAGVHRSTIYGHWPDPDTLLLDAIDRVMTPHAPTAITDDLEADLTTALTGLRQRLGDQPFLIWFATLLDHANRDETFAAAQQRFVNGILQPISDILTAARGRGDLADDVAVAQVAAQLAAPILTDHVMLRVTTSDTVITATIKRILDQAQRPRAASCKKK